VKKKIQNVGPVMVGTGSGALHKEGTGLSTHLLELSGVSKHEVPSVNKYNITFNVLTYITVVTPPV
jgi:hypothetical protein